ncbi:MAG: hypothetical protein QXV17_07480 [Candidatus Micrarchaeaceae archaeon]
MTIGYQYDYKGTVIILNSPTFQSGPESQSLITPNTDMNSILQNVPVDEFWVFANVWPTNVPGPDFTYTGTDLIDYTVTWQ